VVDALIGDPTKAGEKLGWTPTIDGKELAKLMVNADVTALERGPEWIDTVDLASWTTEPSLALQ
jgi:GDPmannose 4,6-dehydratase